MAFQRPEDFHRKGLLAQASEPEEATGEGDPELPPLTRPVQEVDALREPLTAVFHVVVHEAE